MKTLFSFAFLLFFCTLSFAQNSAVSTAIMSEKDGNLDIAKKKIDESVVNEVTSKSAKAHFHRGVIYDALMKSENPKYSTLCGDTASEVAYVSYQKALELDKVGGDYHKRAKENIEVLWNVSINYGAKLFNEGKFDRSLNYYATAKKIKPHDSLAYLNSMVAITNILANNKGNEGYMKMFEEHFEWLDKRNLTDISNYRNALIIYQNRDDKEKSYHLIKKAVHKYPDDKAFLLTELNYLLERQEYNGITKKLAKVLELDPNNGSLHSLHAQFLEQEGNIDQALVAYDKAMALTNNQEDMSFYRDANFNVGAIHYERGRKRWQESEDLTKKEGMNAYLKNGKVMQDEAKEHFRKAVSYFETVYNVDKKGGKTDNEVVRILLQTYKILGEDEKTTALMRETGN